MARFLFPRVLLLLALIPAIAPGQSGVVSVTPTIVEAGAPELIRVRSSAPEPPQGEWLGRKIQFFREDNAWIALAGVDVEAPVGPSTLHVTAGEHGETIKLRAPIVIHAAHYRTSALSVPPKFVEPGPDAMKEIEEESKVKAKVFASSAAEPLWAGDFHAPVSAQPTDSFGTRRMFK